MYFFAVQSLAYVVYGVKETALRPAPRMISSWLGITIIAARIAIGSAKLPFAYSISQQTTTSLLLHSCTQPLHATDAQPHPPRCSNPTTRTAPYEQAPYDPIEWATPRPDIVKPPEPPDLMTFDDEEPPPPPEEDFFASFGV